MQKIVLAKVPFALQSKFQRCSRQHGKLQVPIPRLNLCKSSLRYSGPLLWNALPQTVKSSNSILIFKNRLIRHLKSIEWTHAFCNHSMTLDYGWSTDAFKKNPYVWVFLCKCVNFAAGFAITSFYVVSVVVCIQYSIFIFVCYYCNYIVLSPPPPLSLSSSSPSLSPSLPPPLSLSLSHHVQSTLSLLLVFVLFSFFLLSFFLSYLLPPSTPPFISFVFLSLFSGILFSTSYSYRLEELLLLVSVCVMGT